MLAAYEPSLFPFTIKVECLGKGLLSVYESNFDSIEKRILTLRDRLRLHPLLMKLRLLEKPEINFDPRILCLIDVNNKMYSYKTAPRACLTVGSQIIVSFTFHPFFACTHSLFPSSLESVDLKDSNFTHQSLGSKLLTGY